MERVAFEEAELVLLREREARALLVWLGDAEKELVMEAEPL